MLPVLVSPVSYLWFDLMKLALPSFLLWLAGFYMLFHCILNIAAELTRFGDRLFFLGKEENAGTPLCPALLTPACFAFLLIAAVCFQIGGTAPAWICFGESGMYPCMSFACGTFTLNLRCTSM